MTVIIIVGVILALGAPAFQEIIESNRLRTSVNKISTALYLAKSEAITRGDAVYMCPSSDGATCSGNYSAGWIVHIGTAATTPTRTLRAFDGLSSRESVHDKTGALVTDPLSFLPDGSSSAQVFTVCPPDGDTTKAWGVELNVVGRPRVKKGDASWNCTIP